MDNTLIILGIGIAAILLYLYRKRQEKANYHRGTLLRAKRDALAEASMHDPKTSERRPRDWSLRREYALRRDGHRCTRCLATGNLQVHHVVPVSIRVDHSVSNLITLCVHCHAEEGGHGKRIVDAARGAKATRFRYDERKARSDYQCSKCRAPLPKGSKTYVKRSKRVDDQWENNGVRICAQCMLSSTA